MKRERDIFKTWTTTILKIKFTLWLNDRQPVKVLKSLNDRQSDIFLKFKESKDHIQLKIWYVDYDMYIMSIEKS